MRKVKGEFKKVVLIQRKDVKEAIEKDGRKPLLFEEQFLNGGQFKCHTISEMRFPARCVIATMDSIKGNTNRLVIKKKE